MKLVAGGKANGLATAVEMLGGLGELPGADGEQASMFADADDAPGPLPPVERTGKAGRPKGARNRSTEEWRQFFLGQHQAPVMVMGGIYSRSTEDLARALFLTREVAELAPGQTAIKELFYSPHGERAGECRGYLVWDLERAFDKQMAAVEAALPYLHQKQPMAIETNGQSAGVIVIGDVAGARGDGDGNIIITVPQPQQKQQVIDAEVVQSDGQQSEAMAKSLRHQEEPDAAP